MSVERRGTKALELWAKRATEGYAGVSISNMTTAWRNGLAFCALIHSYRPDLIDYASLKEENILENNALAYRIAEQQLGIPALLDAEDMVQTEIPDRLSVLTYVSQYYQAFTAQGLTSPNRISKTNTNSNTTSSPNNNNNNNNNTNKTNTIPSSTASTTVPAVNGNEDKKSTTTTPAVTTKSSPSPPQALPRTKLPICHPVKSKTEFKTDKVLLGGRGRREMCTVCSNPVFLAERLLVGSPGQLLHRTCFRCARCSNQLTLASYYETENSQFCCETCPDEERDKPVSLPSPQLLSDESDSDSSDDSTDSDLHCMTSDRVLTEEDRFAKMEDIPPPAEDSPRGVFLLETLNGPANDGLNDHSLDHIAKNSAMESTSNASDDPLKEEMVTTQNSNSQAKAIKTVPPDDEQLDTGQDAKLYSDLERTRASSIVSSRLKMFDKSDVKISSKSSLSIKSENNIEAQDKESDKDSDNKSTENITKNIYPNLSNVETLDINETASNLPETSNQENISKDDNNVNNLDTNKTNDNSNNINLKSEEPVPIENCTIGNSPDENLQLSSNLENEIPVHKEEITLSDNDVVSSNQNTCIDKEDIKPIEKEIVEKEITLKETLSPTEEDIVSPDLSIASEGSTPHDSREEVSTASIHTPKHIPKKPTDTSKPIEEKDYPDDLNPFGSDNEEETLDESVELPQPENKEQLNAKTEKLSEDSPKKLIKANINPFDSDDEVEELNSKTPEKKNLNPFLSDDEEDSSRTSTPKPKPPRPPPPTVLRNSISPYNSAELRRGSVPSRQSEGRELFPSKPSTSKCPPSPSPSTTSAPGGSGGLRLKRKTRLAPPPPGHGLQTSPGSDRSNFNYDSISMASTVLIEDKEEKDEVLSCKMQKDLANQSKMDMAKNNLPAPTVSTAGSQGPTPREKKSEFGEWRRKKGPAPPRPVPQKRAIQKLPMHLVQQELTDIDVKQTELERQGVLLETNIRERTENLDAQREAEASCMGVSSGSSSGPSSIEVEDMILQLFDLVNEKNELFRRQTELMYLKREKRLEEEYVELEYQIRCLMMKPSSARTPEDAQTEEELIGRLVKIVEQRDEIINCLEQDRLREAQEDQSIATHMMKYQDKHIDGIDSSDDKQSPKKKKKALKLLKKKKKDKKKKEASGEKVDADKDVDETEVKPKKKKKWFK